MDSRLCEKDLFLQIRESENTYLSSLGGITIHHGWTHSPLSPRSPTPLHHCVHMCWCATCQDSWRFRDTSEAGPQGVNIFDLSLIKVGTAVVDDQQNIMAIDNVKDIEFEKKESCQVFGFYFKLRKGGRYREGAEISRSVVMWWLDPG